MRTVQRVSQLSWIVEDVEEWRGAAEIASLTELTDTTKL